MSSVLERWVEEAGPRVLERIRSKRLSLIPKRIEVLEETDSLGEPAWRLVLVLPAPAGETWDRESVFKARRAAVSAFDTVAAEEGRMLSGRTVAFVTTDEADLEDTAVEETPKTGEDPGYGR